MAYKHDYDKILTRLIIILARLNDGEALSVKELAEELNVPLLGEIPLVQSVREAGDAGRPAVLQEGTPQAEAFMEMAKNVAQQVSIANAQKKEPAAVASN